MLYSRQRSVKPYWCSPSFSTPANSSHPKTRQWAYRLWTKWSSLLRKIDGPSVMNVGKWPGSKSYSVNWDRLRIPANCSLSSFSSWLHGETSD